MSKQGYVIAKNKAVDAFFTSTSSFDRPNWISIKEAKVYSTAELAEKAAKKLYGYGAYEARIVPLAEAIELELPDEDLDQALAPEDKDDEKAEMTAMVQGGDDTAIDQGGETPEIEGQVDIQLGIADKVDRQAVDVALDAEDDLDDEDLAADASVAGGPDGAPIFGESETMPAKPLADAQPSENKQTAIDLPKVPKIKYGSDDNTEEEDLTKSGAWPNGATVKTPANVLQDLKTAIDVHQKSADIAAKYDDAKASFCMTVVGAFQELLQDLEEETAEGIKAAQIHMTSWMNPITALLPYSVQQFVTLGGRKPSLKQMFDTKKSQAK